jgi:hypothetical protein
MTNKEVVQRFWANLRKKHRRTCDLFTDETLDAVMEETEQQISEPEFIDGGKDEPLIMVPDETVETLKMAGATDDEIAELRKSKKSKK